MQKRHTWGEPGKVWNVIRDLNPREIKKEKNYKTRPIVAGRKQSVKQSFQAHIVVFSRTKTVSEILGRRRMFQF